MLRKCAGFCSSISRPADWYETQVEVEDASGFRPGDGVMIWSPSDRGRGPPVVIKDSLVGVNDGTLNVSRRLDRDAWPAAGAAVSLAFPLLTAIGERGWDGGSGDAGVRAQVSDLKISGIVLDGNREENHDALSGKAIDGNYSAAVFLQNAHRITFENVTVRHYNGDGFSFQVCDDIQFRNCCAEDCGPIEQDGKAEGLGFHPGSGSQRPVFEDCVSKRNGQGIFFCWGVTDGIVRRCVCADNRDAGITIGHRDTDNLIEDSVVESNWGPGLLIGRADSTDDWNGAHRNWVHRVIFRNNAGVGLAVERETRDTHVRECVFETNAEGEEDGRGRQLVAIRIGEQVKSVQLSGNVFRGRCNHEILQLAHL